MAGSLLTLGRALRGLGDAEGARTRIAEAARAARELGLRRPALQAQFHLLLQDLLDGRIDGVVETMAWLAQQAAGTDFTLPIVAEKPMTAWAAAERGSYDRARALLHDAGAPHQFPRVPSIGYAVEGLAEAFLRGVAAGRTDLLADTKRLWADAAEIWGACRREERAEHARTVLETLG
jgi:hypothetical protein